MKGINLAYNLTHRDISQKLKLLHSNRLHYVAVSWYFNYPVHRLYMGPGVFCARNAQGIEAEILLCRSPGTKDWSGKPGFRRFEVFFKAPEMRPKQRDKNP
jgi:hypothetical protein